MASHRADVHVAPCHNKDIHSVAMHPRNPYRTPPDFAELAKSYPSLQPFIKEISTWYTLDFHNPNAQRCLTQALLHRDFRLSLEIPENRLCPPVPNRLNYILWLQDIINSTSDSPAQTGVIRGVDIGTGASAIYPLLGCALNPTWEFVATEIDHDSSEYARRNVQTNNLQSRVEVIKAKTGDPILPTRIIEAFPRIDFTMCNPPFYSNREDILNSAEAKAAGPSAICTGADTEMVTDGGEVQFVCGMIRESVSLGSRCSWYTSMVGRMSSLTNIVALLKEVKVDNYAITEFVQGKTRRWAIAWSFGEARLPDVFARIANPALQSIMPPRNTLKQPYPTCNSRDELWKETLRVLSSVEGSSIIDETTSTPFSLLLSAAGNTWSRAARRKKHTAVTDPETHRPTSQLLCRIHCTNTNEEAITGGLELAFHWILGRDRGLFESFMSHVARKIGTAVKAMDVDMAQC